MLLFCPVSALHALEASNLSGIVTDPTGAAILHATVQLQSTDSAFARTATTSDAGSFEFLAIPVGHYRMELSQPGFKTWRQSNFPVAAESSLRLEIHLELGASSDSIVVNEAPVAIESTSTQLGSELTTQKLAAVPLNGRSFTDLMAVEPGIIPASSAQPNAVIMTGVTSTPPSGNENPGAVSISGQRETANGFRVNGSDVEEDVNMGTSILPNLDSIEEMRVLTSNFDAEYGNYSGGQVVVTTKSGGNQFHGDAFEFLRNTKLDAKNYFSLERAKYNQNQFGATLGGPALKNHLYFFADYQGTRLSQGLDTGLISVPSIDDRSGNLTDVADQLTGVVADQGLATHLTAQLGQNITVNEPFYTAGCINTSECVFPNAQFDSTKWSGPASHLLSYLPKPNVDASSFSTVSGIQTLRDDKGALRLDADTHWGNLSAYYFVDDYSLDNPYPTGQGGANVPGFNALNRGRAQLIALGDTKLFGTAAVNEFHFSFMRNANNMGAPVGGVGPSLASQGFTTGAGTLGIDPLAPSIEGIENIAFNDFTIGVDTTGLTQANNIYQWIDNYSRTVGNHTLKFGGEFHLDQINTNPDVVNNGSFSFTGSETGSDFVDFLLGTPSNFTQGQARSFYNRNHYLGLYAQDSWKALSNLTLNYGLRWDLIAPWSEKYNQLQTLIPGEQSAVFPDAPTGLVFPGDKGVPSTLAPTRYSNFSPRIGLAWSPRASSGWLSKVIGAGTSIRSGFGLYYTAFEGLSAGIMSANPPYGFTYTSAEPPLFDTPYISAATGNSLGQRFPLPTVAYGASPSHPNTSVDWTRFEPLVGVPAVDHNDVVPYAENYMLSIERQLTQATVLDLSYVGTQSHHQLVLLEANPGDPALCLSLSTASAVASGSQTCGPFKESSTFTTAAGKAVQGTRTVFGPEFGSVELQKTIANAHYNALEASLKHNSGPLEFVLGYTWSKSIDQSSGLPEPVNPINPAVSRALSSFDLHHSFVASYRYNLPFAQWLPAGNRTLQLLSSGWALSGLTRLTTGFPVTLYNNNDTSLLGTIPNGINNNGIDTLDFAGGSLGIHHDPRGGKSAFDTAKFALPGLGTEGNTSRRFFYGPGMENFDMALMKEVQLSNNRSLQLRAESFNTFNHPQFFGAASVDGNISSGNFGKVENAGSPRLLQLAAKFLF